MLFLTISDKVFNVFCHFSFGITLQMYDSLQGMKQLMS